MAKLHAIRQDMLPPEPQKNIQPKVELMKNTVPQLDITKVKKEFTRIRHQLEFMKKNYAEEYKVAFSALFKNKLDPIEKNIEKYIKLEREGKYAEATALENETIEMIRQYNTEMTEKIQSVKNAYTQTKEDIQTYAEGRGKIDVQLEGIVEKEDIQAFLQELFPESRVSQFIRKVTGQEKSELHWAQKIAMAPAIGLEGAITSFTDLFKKETYRKFLLNAEQFASMSWEDWKNLWATVKRFSKEMDAETTIAELISLVFASIFLSGGYLNFIQKCSKMSTFARVEPLLQKIGAASMSLATRSLSASASIAPKVPIAILGSLIFTIDKKLETPSK